jgi:hypothetical protein
MCVPGLSPGSSVATDEINLSGLDPLQFVIVNLLHSGWKAEHEKSIDGTPGPSILIPDAEELSREIRNAVITGPEVHGAEVNEIVVLVLSRDSRKDELRRRNHPTGRVINAHKVGMIIRELVLAACDEALASASDAGSSTTKSVGEGVVIARRKSSRLYIAIASSYDMISRPSRGSLRPASLS